jgi:hypothetical protein
MKTRSRRKPERPAGSALAEDGPSPAVGAAWAGFVITAVVTGLILRVSGLYTDLWLDEAWTAVNVRNLHSISEIWTRYQTENNHFLNTLFLYALRDTSDWRLYRLLSLLLGGLSVGVAAALGFARGRLEGFFVTVIFALWYPLVFYSSEARGYAPVVFFALAAFWALERFWETESNRAAAAFAACSILGLLSQFIFVHAWAASLAWSLWRLGTGRNRLGRRSILVLLRLHGIPCALLAVLYFGFVRNMAEGQGPHTSYPDVAAQAAALALGLPFTPVAGGVAIVVFAAVLGLELTKRRLRESGEWVFHSTVIVLSPLAVVILLRYKFLMPRHLLLSGTFFLLLLGRLLARLYGQGGRARLGALLGLGLFLSGNLWQTGCFLSEGRGHYLDALKTIVRRSGSAPITIGGDHDFRNALLVMFYRSYLPPGTSVTYLPIDEWPPEGPEWVLVHNPDPQAQPLPTIVPRGIPFTLDAEYRFRGLSGFCWFVYRRS